MSDHDRDEHDGPLYLVVTIKPRLDRLAEAGVAREKLVVIPHAVFDSAPDAEPGEPEGRSLLFFGLIRGAIGCLPIRTPKT